MITKRTMTWTAAAALTAALTLASPAGAAKKEPEPPKPTTLELQGGVVIDTVNVALVNVEVYVTDKKGNRVTGLTRDDFELLENGRPIAISHFAAAQEGRLRSDAPDEPPPAEAAPPVHPAEPPPSTIPDDQRLFLVVYIDNFNIQPFNRNRVLRELRDFLRNKLDTEDRVMLVTYDRELHVRHPWTRDPAVIAAALQELETLTGSAVHRESDRRDALERIEETESAQEAESIVRSYAGSLYNDLAFSLDALRDLVHGLAGMPGRKAVLYVSEGLPMIAGEDLFHAVQQKFGEYSALTRAFEFDASRRFDELTAAANANRVTFYTIDAGGLRTYGYADASHQTAGQGAFVEQIYISNLQSTLQRLAEDTGGKAIINANRVAGPLEAVAQDFDTFYSLGYTPAHFGDGRYYKLEVKVKGRRDLEARHRQGYRDKPVDVRMSDGTMAALLHQFEANPLGVKLDFGEPARENSGHYLVPIKVSIPIGHVVLLPGEANHEARLRLFVAAMDSEGGMSEVQQMPVPIRIPAAEIERARQQLYLYSLSLLMRKGPHRVAIGLRDDLGADTSFITGTVVVGN